MSQIRRSLEQNKCPSLDHLDNNLLLTTLREGGALGEAAGSFYFSRGDAGCSLLGTLHSWRQTYKQDFCQLEELEIAHRIFDRSSHTQLCRNRHV